MPDDANAPEDIAGPEDPTDADDAVLAEGRRLLDAAESRLAAVERALARLDDGSYGRCDLCDAPIEPSLLRIDPGRTRCGAHEATA